MLQPTYQVKYIHYLISIAFSIFICYNLVNFFQHNAGVHTLYEILRKKIDNDLEPMTTTAVSPDPDYLDSPLMSVPTPAPL